MCSNLLYIGIIQSETTQGLTLVNSDNYSTDIQSYGAQNYGNSTDLTG